MGKKGEKILAGKGGRRSWGIYFFFFGGGGGKVGKDAIKMFRLYAIRILTR